MTLADVERAGILVQIGFQRRFDAGYRAAQEAVAAGAAAVAVQADAQVPDGVAALRVPSTRSALGELAAELYGRPARLLRVAGITGTDGKTTTTHMAEHVLQASGIVAGAMSTVAYSVAGRESDNTSGQTTTEAHEIQAWLKQMVDAGVRAAVIETTSHALVQERVNACDFDVAAFTNVGHDHLDYHATWEEYLEAKARLIDLASRRPLSSTVTTRATSACRAGRSHDAGRMASRPPRISTRWSSA